MLSILEIIRNTHQRHVGIVGQNPLHSRQCVTYMRLHISHYQTGCGVFHDGFEYCKTISATIVLRYSCPPTAV
jgi:hypothetical protein